MNISPRDILFRCGATDLLRYGRLCRTTSPEELSALQFKETFTRASTKKAIGPDGVVRGVGINFPAVEWYDLNGDGTRETPALLLENARTNSFLQSQALATTWSASNLTATNNSASAPDATTTATKLVPSAANVASHRVSQPVTITAAEQVCISFYFKASGYNAVLIQVVDAATNTNGFSADFDVSLGALGTFFGAGGTGTFVGRTITALGDSWYRVQLWGKLGGAITAATCLVDVFDTIAHANSVSAYVGDTVSGVLAWGAQWERTGTTAGTPSSYIPTTVGTATRNVDVLSFPWPYKPQAMWAYCKFVELGGGWILPQDSVRLFGVDTAPYRFQVINGGSQGEWEADCSNATVFSRSAMSTPAPVGSTIELLATWTSAGLPNLRWSIAGAADGVGTSSDPAATFASNWSSGVLGVGSSSVGTLEGFTALISLKIGQGTSGLPAAISDVRSLP